MSLTPGTPVIAEGLPITFRDQTVWRDPEVFEDTYMLAVDFDETCFTTFISHGKGIEVHEAYEISVEQVLGPDARQDFSDYGGLSNRAPLDVIESLLTTEPRLITHALAHAQDHFANPADITDIGLGLIARFADRDRPDHDELTVRAITEMLVARKKEHLIPQIGPDWPQPVRGFDTFWNNIRTRRAADERWKRVHTAIVSSGHTDFIRKTLQVAGLADPDVYMTDDEMRRQVRPRTKPDPYALQLVRNAWMNAYLVPKERQADDDFMKHTKGRSVYIGDDTDKDGNMATNDGIRFIHHDNAPDTWSVIDQRISNVVESRADFGTTA